MYVYTVGVLRDVPFTATKGVSNRTDPERKLEITRKLFKNTKFYHYGLLGVLCMKILYMNVGVTEQIMIRSGLSAGWCRSVSGEF